MSRTRIFQVLAACAIAYSLLFGSLSAQRSHSRPAPTPASPETPSDRIVRDLVKMESAGLSDEIMIKYIRQQGQTYTFTTDQLIHMKDAGLSESVINVLMTSQPPSTERNAVPVTAMSAQPPRRDGGPAAPVRPTLSSMNSEANDANPTITETVDSVDSEDRNGVPTEIGVYLKQQGAWHEVLPEVVNWKSGGVVKSVRRAALSRAISTGTSRVQAAEPSAIAERNFLLSLQRVQL